MDKDEIQEVEGLPEPVKPKHTRITVSFWGIGKYEGKSIREIVEMHPGETARDITHHPKKNQNQFKTELPPIQERANAGP